MNQPPRPFAQPAANYGTTAKRAAAGTTSVNWTALHDAASAVGLLAGIAPEKASKQVRNFPAQIRDAEDWRKNLVESGIADLSAIMTPGLTALLAVRARGQDAAAPAGALMHEFYAARDALLAIIPASGELGPRRSA